MTLSSPSETCSPCSACDCIEFCPQGRRYNYGLGVLQCVALCRVVLQVVAVFCNVLECNFAPKAGVAIMDSACCSVLQCVAVCCSVFAVCWSVMLCVAAWCSACQCVAVCVGVLQRSSALQCGAVRCSELQSMFQCVLLRCNVV